MKNCPKLYSGILSPWIRSENGKFALVRVPKSIGLRMGLHKTGWLWDGEEWATTDVMAAMSISRALRADIRDGIQAQER